MLNADNIAALLEANHGDPFAVLGMHVEDTGTLCVSCFLPGAQSVELIDSKLGRRVATLERAHLAGFFEARLPRRKNPFAYHYAVSWEDGSQAQLEDPYRFPPVLAEADAWLLAEGTHMRPYEVLGAHPREIDGVEGVAFAVWAPNALRVSVVGDFNAWDGRRHPMRLRRECGVWEIFLPGVGVGALYKFELRTRSGEIKLKADPLAFAAELRPRTASVVAGLPPPRRLPPQRRAANALDAPVSVYEVHAGSWRRRAQPNSDGTDFLDWDELAAELVPYVRELGFTHIELMPISEYPYDASWGYQPVGLYAPSARFGCPAAFARFVAAVQDAGMGLLLDWVPGHFPVDSHGLGHFDGTPLYEHADPREGYHPDWNTLIYNFGRNEVRNFLIGNALYWLERFGIDGLRVDAVASLLYRDYSRRAGEWVPNHYGGRENLEAIAFLRRMNEVIGEHCPGAVTMAEESTAWPAVSRPPYAGGLGFHYKWNMGWMHDTLHYMQRDPIYRGHHHNEMSFGLVYAFDENFVLPLSHDEVVHGKGSLIARMPGDGWQKFANLRAYFGFMWGHPGKKLLFMGGEFAQGLEWNHERSLDWQLLDHPWHRGVQHLVRDLNALYRRLPALHQRDCQRNGFAWLDLDNAAWSVLAFARLGQHEGELVVTACNFTPEPRLAYRIGVPRWGRYREVLNTDAELYGGSNLGNGDKIPETQAVPWGGFAQSIEIVLPPLATVFFQFEG